VLESLGFEEILVVVVLGLLILKPSELAAGLRKLMVAKATLQSWWQGMWQGWMEEGK